MQKIIWERRKILGALAGVSALPVAASAKGALSGHVRIAVKYHMINEPDLSVREKFQLLKEIGFDGVELKTTEKVSRDEVTAAIEETGLPVHGIVNASSPDIAAGISLASDLGADSVLVLAAQQKDLSFEKNFLHWQGLVKRALPLAREKSVVLCIENVRATFLKEAEQMVRFIDQFESKWVRSYFDLGNTITWTGQSAQHWAGVLGKRVYKLDIKDRGHPEFGEPKLKRRGAVGTNGGEVHWEMVRRILAANQFNGWATAEVRGGRRDRLEGIAKWMRDVLDLS